MEARLQPSDLERRHRLGRKRTTAKDRVKHDPSWRHAYSDFERNHRLGRKADDGHGPIDSSVGIVHECAVMCDATGQRTVILIIVMLHRVCLSRTRPIMVIERRAKLAYDARQLKRVKKIIDCCPTISCASAPDRVYFETCICV